MASGYRLGHLPALDGIRGLACLMVFAVHLPYHPAPLTGGFFGVDVFFVLSGFLITRLLLQEHGRTGSIHLPRFYLRRALRLLPAVLVMLLGSWAYARLCYPPEYARPLARDVVSVLGYYANWRWAFVHGWHAFLIMHTWSLAIEEQFYLVWPLALACLLRCRARRRWVVAVAVAGVLAPAVARAALWHGPASLDRVYNGTDTRADGLMWGCLAAFAVAWGPAPNAGRARAALRIAGLAAAGLLAAHAALVPDTRTAYLYQGGGFTTVGLATAVLLVALVHAPPPRLARLLANGALGWFGRISYGFYLWHFPVLAILGSWTPVERLGPALKVPVLFAGCLLAACASYYLVERPFLRLKDRLDAPRRTAAQPAPALAAAA